MVQNPAVQATLKSIESIRDLDPCSISFVSTRWIPEALIIGQGFFLGENLFGAFWRPSGLQLFDKLKNNH